jgi:hypothetical protein
MTESLLNTPILWINSYIQEKLATVSSGIGVPFFPSRPSNIEDLTEQYMTVNGNIYPYSGVMSTWDRMFRMRRSPFPHIKDEQVLYYFYATQENATEKMIQVQEHLLRMMDREDETAEEINLWAKNKGAINVGTEQSPINVTNKFYFHTFKVYQLEEVRDVIDFGTTRTFGGNKIIIDYKYHQMPDLTNNDQSL